MDSLSVIAETAASFPTSPESNANGAEDAALSFLPMPPASSSWYALDAHHCDLLHIVPSRSKGLERTTILTWMYLQQGSISFDQLVCRVAGDDFKTLKKKYVRRAMRGLARIGAATLHNIEPAGPKEVHPEIDSDAKDGEAPIGKHTTAEITSAGMTWLRRAWQARYIGMDDRPALLSWIHEEYLLEEEDGKGNEPYWIEKFGGTDDNRKPLNRSQISTWLGGNPVASVFDLSHALANTEPATQSLPPSQPRMRRKLPRRSAP